MSGYQGANPLNPYASVSPWASYGGNALTPWASAWSSYMPGAMPFMPQGQWSQWQQPQGQWQGQQPGGYAPYAAAPSQQSASQSGQQQQPSLFDQSAWLGPAQSMWLQGQGASDFDVLRAGLNVPGISDEGRANIYQALQQYGGPPASGYSRPNMGGGGTG